MSVIAVNSITDAAGGNTATINGTTPTADSLQGFRNRIINGAMVIDQRNNGASVTAGGAYPVDRFTMTNSTDGTYTAQQDSSAPSGFTNSVKITVGTADASLTTTQRLLIDQKIEGFNVADLGWGAANAQSVTISFWVRSSLTGTFAGSLQNDARNRSYPFTYAINAADTWEQKSVTVAGDTTGTWVKNNGVGMVVIFALGVGPSLTGSAGAWAGSDFRNATGAVSLVGTAGATFYITGVQLEAGSVASPFERRPYGTELALCQRYYYKLFPGASNRMLGSGYNSTTTVAGISGFFPVTLRTRPSALEQSGAAADYTVAYLTTGATCSSVPAYDSPTTDSIYAVLFTVASGLTAGQGCQARTSANTTGYLAWSAEL